MPDARHDAVRPPSRNPGPAAIVPIANEPSSEAAPAGRPSVTAGLPGAAMDRPRAARGRARRLVGVVGLAGLLLVVSLVLARLEPAPPSVPRTSVFIDSVQRGDLRIEIRSPGTLVPESVEWIAAATEGVVVAIPERPGVTVAPDTVLVVLASPALEAAVREAAWAVARAEAELAHHELELRGRLLDQEAALAALRAEAREAAVRHAANVRLSAEHLVSPVDLDVSAARAESTSQRLAVEEERLALRQLEARAAARARAAGLAQLRDALASRRDEAAGLHVTAGTTGVLQQVTVEVGERVTPGTLLARLADPARLRAELRVAQSLAKDIVVGQAASIDTRAGLVTGRVSRIDPAVLDGTVTVDVAIEGELPTGARPDLAIEGTVIVAHLRDVLHLGRPALARAGEAVGLYRIRADGRLAERVRVRLGRSSVSRVEVRGGLSVGDEVILSDSSAWDHVHRIRLD